MKANKSKKLQSSEQLGFCLTLHFASLENIDEEIKSSIANFLERFPESKWKRGNYWMPSTLETLDTFNQSFEHEIKDYEKYYEGIQTRSIGSIVIENPSIILKETKVSTYIVSFRKIHESYCAMFFALSKNLNLELLDCSKVWNNLETETLHLIELLYKNKSTRFKHNLLGPATVFYLITKSTACFEPSKIEEDIKDGNSILHKLPENLLCAKGVKPEKLPLSTLDNKVIVLRHPSYNFSPEMSEKFLLLPTVEEKLEFYIRTVDILSSIEYFFTKLFKYARTIDELLTLQDEKSSLVLPLMERVSLLSDKKEITQTTNKLSEKRMELLKLYHLANKAKYEIAHIYEAMSYLIDGALIQSSYSQILEKPMSDRIEGVIKSIKIEAEMRVRHVEMYVPRIGTRSYGLISELTKILTERLGKEFVIPEASVIEKETPEKPVEKEKPEILTDEGKKKYNELLQLEKNKSRYIIWLDEIKGEYLIYGKRKKLTRTTKRIFIYLLEKCEEVVHFSKLGGYTIAKRRIAYLHSYTGKLLKKNIVSVKGIGFKFVKTKHRFNFCLIYPKTLEHFKEIQL